MSGERSPIEGRGEAVLSIFKRGAEFTEELLEQNERLRGRVAALEGRQNEAARNPAQWEALRRELTGRISSLEVERRSILERLHSVQEENRHFADRYFEIEEENNNLANLYVASYQLHSTLDPDEVLKVILEIVINLVGAEIFCVYALDEAQGALEPVASEGAPKEAFPRVSCGVGFVGESVESGEVATLGSEPRGCEADGVGTPMVCIPLRVSDRPVGAIAIHRLLQQKDGLSSLDRELFRLLAGHAATALFSSRLYAQSERKLSTIQGFIELLAK